ncbi:MAG TPA: hypothetical protein VL371_00155 [Gemmataceae bacterium]|jgi:hypothetical protein|nr:hypothetical protein [Gemmataceae bacterium]
MKSHITGDLYLVLVQSNDGVERHAVTATSFRNAADSVEAFLNFLPEDDVAAVRMVRVRADEMAAIAGRVPAMRQSRQLSARGRTTLPLTGRKAG